MKPDFPSLTDEIAEPHPDMNIKVAAFTVSEKSSNTTVTVKLITYLIETKRASFCLNAFKFGCVHLAHTLMCHFSLF